MNPYDSQRPCDPVRVRILRELRRAENQYFRGKRTFDGLTDLEIDRLFGRDLPAAKKTQCLNSLKSLGLVECKRLVGGATLWVRTADLDSPRTRVAITESRPQKSGFGRDDFLAAGGRVRRG